MSTTWPSVNRATSLVIDTNILLADPLFWEVVAVDEVIIPEVVLHELDGLKKAGGQVGFQAREANRIIGQLAGFRWLKVGVTLKPGTLVRVVPTEAIARSQPRTLQRKADHAVIATALYCIQVEQRRGVRLLSNDTGVRTIANIYDLEAISLEGALAAFRYLETPPTVLSRQSTVLALIMGLLCIAGFVLGYVSVGPLVVSALPLWLAARLVGKIGWGGLRNFFGVRKWRPLAHWIEGVVFMAWFVLLMRSAPTPLLTLMRLPTSAPTAEVAAILDSAFLTGRVWLTAGSVVPLLFSLFRLPRGPVPRRVWERLPLVDRRQLTTAVTLVGVGVVVLALHIVSRKLS